MSQPLRIAFLSTVHPHPWAPTKGVFNQGMLASLVEAGAEVDAVVPVPWTERRGDRAEIELDYQARFPTWWYLPRVAPLHLAAQMRWSTRAARRRVARPDIVLAYWTDPDGTCAATWASELGVPFVQVVGGSDVLVLGNDLPRRDRMIRTLRSADRVLTIGSGLRAALEGWGLDPRKVSSFQRGVDHSRFSPGSRTEARTRLGLPADRPILAWVGRLVDVKGVDVLLSALQSSVLLAQRPLVVLLGDGPNRSSLESIAERTLPPDTVRFIGKVGHEALPDWYRAADLMVLPSHSEGVPNVLLESMACGTGFVASAVGGIPDLATDPQRELVPPGNIQALTEALVARLTGEPINPRAVPDRRETASRLLEKLKILASGEGLP